MTISRDMTNKIRFMLDEFTPPIIRDCYWFMFVPLKLILKKNAETFLNFKNSALQISSDNFSAIYKALALDESRQTDLNMDCMSEILNNITGKTVLEVGAGNGHLSSKISQDYTITATDIVFHERLNLNPNIMFRIANIERLPFKDRSFDTVICTHTLEHVQNIFKAICELRRVAKKRLIIVVPKQRPYQYTFDLHLHFFPYKFSLLAIMNDNKKHKFSCKEIGGDWFYKEEV